MCTECSSSDGWQPIWDTAASSCACVEKIPGLHCTIMRSLSQFPATTAVSAAPSPPPPVAAAFAAAVPPMTLPASADGVCKECEDCENQFASNGRAEEEQSPRQRVKQSGRKGVRDVLPFVRAMKSRRSSNADAEAEGPPVVHNLPARKTALTAKSVKLPLCSCVSDSSRGNLRSAEGEERCSGCGGVYVAASRQGDDDGVGFGCAGGGRDGQGSHDQEQEERKVSGAHSDTIHWRDKKQLQGTVPGTKGS